VRDHLEWVDAPLQSLGQWPAWAAFAADAERDGLDRALVLGMGGSSLVARVLARSFGSARLNVLDSTDPEAVRAAERAAPLQRTVFLVVSKSGTTVETMAFQRYFGARAGARQFVAITDPGSPLERLARDGGFRAVFPHPARVGGRFSALTVVGLLPAALAGIDGRTILERAQALDPATGHALGARVAAAARAGRDKLVLQPPTSVSALASWIEQLVAESSGKEGKGVIPILDEPPDRTTPDREVVTQFSADPLDLGAEFLKWMHATVELCRSLGVNPFDQPDVEEAKAFARAELDRGALAASAPATLSPTELRRAARPGDYLAILAYLPPRAEITTALQRVRAIWSQALGCATTIGFGPRYLHSTGQLHKGGPNTGVFLMITADDPDDLDIPGMRCTFGQLKRAQAIGDVRALLARGRRVAHVHLERWEDVEQLAVV
jgi:phosphoglucose isomerase-like protein